MNKFIKIITKFLSFVFLFLVFSLVISYAIGFYEGYSLQELFPFGILNFIIEDYQTDNYYPYPVIEKPVIYLYPTKEQKTSVQIEFNGNIIYDYPDYNKNIKGWEVMAYPDGHLINLADNKEYSYIFWEGETNSINYDLTSGFVVKGGDTKVFLQNILSEMGLTPKEYNEFIVYWYPLMKDNKYNLIHFAGKEYIDAAKLTITPRPDSILRVFMVYKSLDSKIDINPQEIKLFERKGFTVIEWGGTEIKQVLTSSSERSNTCKTKPTLP